MSSVGDDNDFRQEEDQDESKDDDEFSIEKFLEEDSPYIIDQQEQNNNSGEGAKLDANTLPKHTTDGLLFVMHEPEKQSIPPQPPNEEQILKDFCVKNLDTGEVSTLFAVDQIQQTNPIYTQLLQKFTNYEKNNPDKSDSKGGAGARLKKKRSKSVIQVPTEADVNDTNSIRIDVQKKKIKQLNQLKEIQTIQGHGEFDGKGITKGAIWCMKFNNTGEFLATGGQDGFIFVWKCLHNNRSSILDLSQAPTAGQPKDDQYSFPPASGTSSNNNTHNNPNRKSLASMMNIKSTIVRVESTKRNHEDSSSEDSSNPFNMGAFISKDTPKDDDFYDTPRGDSPAGSSIGGYSSGSLPLINNDLMMPTIVKPPISPASSGVVFSPYFSEKPIMEYLGPSSGDVIDIAWSHKSNLLLTSSMDMKVRVFYMWKKSSLCAFLHKEIVTSVCFHPRDESIIITGSFDERIRVFSLKQKQLIKFVDTQYLITAIGTSIDGDIILAGTFDGKCLLYHYDHPQYSTVPFMSSKKLLKKGLIDVRSKRGKNRGRKVTGIVCSSNKRHVLISTNDSRVRRYRLTTLTEISKFSGLENKSSQIHATYNADGSLVVAGSENNNAYIWNTGNEFMSSSNLFAKREKNSSFESFPASDCIVTNALFGIVPHKDFRLLEDGHPTPSSAHFSTSNAAAGKNPNSMKGTVVVCSDFQGRIKVFVVGAHEKKMQ